MDYKRFAYLLIFVLCTFHTQAQIEPEKCGTFNSVRRLNSALKFRTDMPTAARPNLQKSKLTPNGKVRIHYDTAGVNQPALVSVTYPNGIKTVTRIPNSYQQFIDTLVTLMDSVWRAEIDQFEFPAPPSDNGRGGGDEYDLYVKDLGGGLFGETNIEFDLPVGEVKTNRQYASFIWIDNDFGSGYRTNGIEAIMATTAHEFHHAVQIGGSGVWEDEHFYFYELFAESMEHTVFRDANDYLFDLKTYFKKISAIPLFLPRTANTTFETAGYERAIWGIFLIKKFGISVIRDIWSEVKVQRPVPALNTVMNRYSTSIQREFANFTYWNFFTAYRADTVRYYTDAKVFPAVPFLQTVNIGSTVKQVQISTPSFTANYLKVLSNTDSAFFVVSNTDYHDAVSYAQNLFTAQLSVASAEQSGYTAVSNGIYANFSANDIENWSYIPIGITAPSYCFPNPFKPSASSLLISPNGIGVSDDVHLSIISAVSMDMIYSQKAEYTSFSGTQYVEWKGRDDRHEIVPSGVYLYILSKGSDVVKGKFAVIR